MKKFVFIIALLALSMLADKAQAQRDYTFNFSKTFVAADTTGAGANKRDTATSYTWDQNAEAYRKFFRSLYVTGVDSVSVDTVYCMTYHGVTKDGPFKLYDSVRVILTSGRDTLYTFANTISTDTLVYRGNFWKVVIVNGVKANQALFTGYLSRVAYQLAHKIEFFWQGKY